MYNGRRVRKITVLIIDAPRADPARLIELVETVQRARAR